MKILQLIAILLFVNYSTAQTYIYDGHGNLIGGSHIQLKPHISYILEDSITGTRFILDSNHINIYALSKIGDTLWKTDPWKDNKLDTYRFTRPVIVYYKFANSVRTKNEEVIWIIYINTQFGIIDKKTGKFRFMGQD